MNIKHMNFDDKKQPTQKIPQIVDHIFAICKEDPTFENSQQYDQVEQEIKHIQSKIKKQDNLLQQSTEIKRTMYEKIKFLDETNSGIRTRLLESLGSEL